jgi:hypothetical protein
MGAAALESVGPARGDYVLARHVSYRRQESERRVPEFAEESPGTRSPLPVEVGGSALHRSVRHRRFRDE